MARRLAPGPARFPDPETLAVIERFSLHLRRSGRLAVRGRPSRRAAAAGLDFVGYADYRQGEDLRHVEWSIWGRSRQLVLRRYADEAAGLLCVLLDASGSMAVGDPPKWALARALAAALVHAALGELHQVLVGLLTPAGLHALPVGAGAGFGPEAFAFLGAARPAGRLRLAEALAGLPLDGARGEVVLISDFLDPDGPGPALEALQIQGLRVDAVRVTAPGELTLPPPGSMLADPEGIEGRPAPAGAARAALEAQLEALRQGLGPAARRAGAAVVELSSAAPLASALERYFEVVSAHRGGR